MTFRSAWPLVVVLSLTLSSLAFFLAPNIVGLFHDDGIYAVVAKALSEGHGYRIISVPGEPHQTKYPFLYSYLLSWIWSVNPRFPENIALLQLTAAVFYFASLLLAYGLYARNCAGGKVDAVLYVFLFGTSAWVFSFAGYSLSDIPFTAAALFSLALSDPAHGFSFRTRSIVLLAAGAGAAFLFRQAGAALILAGLVHFLLSGKRKEFYLYTAIAGGVILPWVLWRATQGPATTDNLLLAYYQSYESPAFLILGSDPSVAFQIVWGNLRYLALTLDHSILRLHAVPPLRFVVYPLMLWGLWSVMRRQTIFFNGFLLFYTALILSWPFHPARYLMPLVPVLLLSLFQGSQAATAMIRARAATAWSAKIIPAVVRIPIAVIAVLTVLWLWNYAHIDRNNYLVLWSGFRATYAWNGFSETFSWVKENTQSDDVLATAYDPMYYLYTGRKAVRPWIHRPETYYYPHGNATPNLGLVQEIRDALDKLGVRFLIVNPLEGYSERIAVAELFTNLLRSYSIEPELVFQSSDGLHKIYALPPHSNKRSAAP